MRTHRQTFLSPSPKGRRWRSDSEFQLCALRGSTAAGRCNTEHHILFEAFRTGSVLFFRAPQQPSLQKRPNTKQECPVCEMELCIAPYQLRGPTKTVAQRSKEEINRRPAHRLYESTLIDSFRSACVPPTSTQLKDEVERPATMLRSRSGAVRGRYSVARIWQVAVGESSLRRFLRPMLLTHAQLKVTVRNMSEEKFGVFLEEVIAVLKHALHIETVNAAIRRIVQMMK